jgi:CRP/FNR family transcriptional regulator
VTDIAEIAEELRRVPFFSKLGQSPLKEIARSARQKKITKGQMLFFENDPCEGFYYLRSGRIKIYKMSAVGREHILHTLKSGETFAEVPTFDNGLCPANAQAVDDSILLLIRRADFEGVTRTYPEVAFGLLHHFARWLRRFTLQLEDLSLKDASARLAGYLLSLADDSGKQTAEGIVINLNENQQQIASRIGTVREVVSRNLGKFQQMGVIRFKGRRIVIRDPQGLKQLT